MSSTASDSSTELDTQPCDSPLASSPPSPISQAAQPRPTPSYFASPTTSMAIHDLRFDVEKLTLDSAIHKETSDAKFERNFAMIKDGFEKMEERFNARFDKMEARFDKVDTRLDRMESRFETRFDNLEYQLDRADARFDMIDIRGNGVERRSQAIEEKLTSVESKINENEQVVQRSFSNYAMVTPQQKDLTTSILTILVPMNEKMAELDESMVALRTGLRLL